MSVLIDSMDIPKSCSDCPLNHDKMSCTVTGTRWRSDTMFLLGFDYTKERLHDCPILEVPSARPEPCEDAVSRKAAVEEIRRHGVGSFDFEDYTPEQAERFVIKLLQDLPSVTPEPCDDAVSRKAVYEAMVEKGQRSRRYRLGETWELNGAEIRETLDTVPPVTPKRKTGKWIDAVIPNDNGGLPVQVCDQCNTFFPLAYTGGGHRFCPSCGAKMEGANGE